VLEHWEGQIRRSVFPYVAYLHFMIRKEDEHDIKCKAKGKAILLQALTDPEVFSRMRLPDFKIIRT
jgi:hypothetical protein